MVTTFWPTWSRKAFLRNMEAYEAQGKQKKAANPGPTSLDLSRTSAGAAVLTQTAGDSMTWVRRWAGFNSWSSCFPLLSLTEFDMSVTAQPQLVWHLCGLVEFQLPTSSASRVEMPGHQGQKLLPHCIPAGWTFSVDHRPQTRNHLCPSPKHWN